MIRISDLNLSLPGFSLNNINLDVTKGEFFALLGPTGSGKTVLLEAIAGLKDINRGSVFINGKEVSKLNPEQRNISILYQDYALFPNMKVRENITYGLKFKKRALKSNHYQDKFDLLVDMLGIGPLINRYPHNLSGGEQQRVALARALIVEPDILLLDEPFSALDVNTKELIQTEIKKIHTTLKTTTIMVTHNFSEVFSLADKVAIIYKGNIEQMGTIQEVFKMPKSNFVAGFVGMKNIFPVHQLRNYIKIVKNQDANEQCYVGLRPEDIVIGKDNLQTDYQLEGVISAVSNNGIYSEVKVKTENISFTAYLTPNRFFELGLNINKYVSVGFNQKDINLIQDKSA